MTTTITITISPKGETTVSVNGVKGSKCKELTRDFEKMLGNVTSDTPTGEFYEQPNVSVVDQY